MTERLYQNNSYLFEFDAIVESVVKKKSYYEIILDKSLFYPESGGQNFDTGTLDNNKVIGVYSDDNDKIVHWCENWDATVGDKIVGVVDKDCRIANMRKHTGQHILSQAFLRLSSADTVGAHLGDTESTIELATLKLTEDDLKSVENKSNEIILQNLPVIISYNEYDKLADLGVRRIPDRQGVFRLVGIGDFELTACGGTHCAFTGEIGLLKIIGVEKIRKHTRITFLCGSEAVKDYYQKHLIVEELSNHFTCHINNIESSIKKLADYNDDLKKEISRLRKELLPYQLQNLKNNATETAGIKIISKVYSDYDFKNLKDLALSITKEFKSIVLFSIEDKLIISVSDGIEHNASLLTKSFIKQFGGKGGGNPAIAQIGGIPVNNMETALLEFVELIKKNIDRK
ncbi:MAG: hypothetical protein GY865_14165 [candidate division Zixibacteria bacterium]|nr:hypothetical protein [candidate division Zixibacteria bacterium]